MYTRKLKYQNLIQVYRLQNNFCEFTPFTHKLKMLFCTVFSAGFKDTKIQIKKRLRFGMANSIGIQLRLNITIQAPERGIYWIHQNTSESKI